MKIYRRVLVAGHADDPVRVMVPALAAWQPYNFAGLYHHIPTRERLTHGGIDIVLGGLGATREFLRKHRGDTASTDRCSTLIVLAIDQEELPHALDVISGCDGVVFVDVNFALMREILHMAEHGLISIPACLMASLVANQPRRSLLKSLTYRELKALVLIGQTLTGDQIAARLEISPSIARNLVRSILRKLRFRNRTEAAVFLHRESRVRG